MGNHGPLLPGVALLTAWMAAADRAAAQNPGWERLIPNTVPAARRHAAVAFDHHRERVVIFAGRGGSWFSLRRTGFSKISSRSPSSTRRGTSRPHRLSRGEMANRRARITATTNVAAAIT